MDTNIVRSTVKIYISVNTKTINKIQKLIQDFTKQYKDLKNTLHEQRSIKQREEHERVMASEQEVPTSTRDSYEEVEIKLMQLYEALNNVHSTMEVLLIETRDVAQKVQFMNRTKELIDQFNGTS